MGKELDEKTKELLLQVKKLKQKNQKLEEELEVTKFNLGERRKELNCYQVIMEYVNNPDLSVEKVLSAIVKIIPSSWQFPELTAAEIVVGNKRYQTNPFKTSKYFIRQDLSIKKEVVGHISVYFTGKLNEQLTEPFLPEEGYLLTSIAKIIDEFLSKEKKRSTIVEDEREKYQNLINNLKEVVFETSPNPVVIISADAMPRQLERLKKAGAYNYLTKLLEIAEFLKVIDNLLDYKKRS